jgi:hypothetical protein
LARLKNEHSLPIRHRRAVRKSHPATSPPSRPFIEGCPTAAVSAVVARADRVASASRSVGAKGKVAVVIRDIMRFLPICAIVAVAAARNSHVPAENFCINGTGSHRINTPKELRRWSADVSRNESSTTTRTSARR